MLMFRQEVCLEGNETSWSRHLDVKVHVFGDLHELDESQASQDGMMSLSEVNYLGLELLHWEAIRHVVGDRQRDSPER